MDSTQKRELLQFVFNGLGVRRHRGAELFQGVGFKVQLQIAGALLHMTFDAALGQPLMPPDPALLVGKGQTAQFGDMGRDLGLPLLPVYFQAEKGPALGRRPGQRLGYLFPDSRGPELGLTDQQDA